MAETITPAEFAPEKLRLESSTGLRAALRAPELPPLPASVTAAVTLQTEMERVMRLYRDQCAYVSELETVLSRRSQELLEADEREAALVRRFHGQSQRLAELDRHIREQNALIERLQASLPKRPTESSELHSIRGIGPKYARALSTLGIGTLAALAALSEDDVRRIEQQLRIKNGRIRRERWVEQARERVSD
jgi:predicted flap endonuclease-1-like 5' DNA nuclease